MKLNDMKNLEKLTQILLTTATYLESQGLKDIVNKPYLDALAGECRQGCADLCKVIY